MIPIHSIPPICYATHGIETLAAHRLFNRTAPPMAPTKIFVTDLVDNQHIETVFLAASKQLRETRNGDPYLCVTLQDATGTIEARAWDDAPALESRFDADDLIAVRGRVSSYRGELQITLADLDVVDDDTVHLGDFLPHSRWDGEAMFHALRSLVERHVQSEEVQRFLHALFDDPEWVSKFKKAPAAVSNHHAFLAGLLEHTLSMARLAVSMGEHYEAYYPGMVDTDLVIAGAIIHDMAKIDELHYRRSFSYSTEGQLIGHIVQGAQRVEAIAQQLSPALDPNLKTQLQHLILSHHGKKEYGAPTTPKTPEALLLHHIDMVDSRMNMCWNALEPMIDSGDTDGEWSDYQRPFGRSLYASAASDEEWKARSVKDSDQGPGIEPLAGPVTDDASSDSDVPTDDEESHDNLDLFG